MCVFLPLISPIFQPFINKISTCLIFFYLSEYLKLSLLRKGEIPTPFIWLNLFNLSKLLLWLVKPVVLLKKYQMSPHSNYLAQAPQQKFNVKLLPDLLNQFLKLVLKPSPSFMLKDKFWGKKFKQIIIHYPLAVLLYTHCPSS